MKINQERLIENREYCEKAFQRFLKNKIIKKDEAKLFRKYFGKSINNMEFANFILEEHNFSIKEKLSNKSFYDWCITIYYYSLYHSAMALVSKAGFESKNHLATITALTLFYYHKYDLLIEIDKDVSLFGVAELKRAIEKILREKIDLVEYDLIRKELKENILNDEILILR